MITDPVNPRSVSNIIINGHRERICFLEHHPDSLPQNIGIHILVNIHTVQCDFSLNPAALYQIIHTVKRLHESGFSAAGRSDQRGNPMFLNAKIDILQRLVITVPEIQIFTLNNCCHNLSLILILRRTAQFFCHQFGCHIDKKGKYQKDQRNGKGHIKFSPFLCIHVQGNRQR